MKLLLIVGVICCLAAVLVDAGPWIEPARKEPRTRWIYDGDACKETKMVEAECDACCRKHDLRKGGRFKWAKLSSKPYECKCFDTVTYMHITRQERYHSY